MALDALKCAIRRPAASRLVCGIAVCALAFLATAGYPSNVIGATTSSWMPDGDGMVFGLGGGFGSQYATMGFKGFVGTDYFIAEAAIGTEPWVWKPTYAAGISVLFLDPKCYVRPKLSVLLKSNASAVIVFEPLEEGEIQDAVEYEPLPGLALLVGAEIFPLRDEPGSLEVSVGWRIPFGGMAKVDEKANALMDQYFWAEYEVATPRLDHFTFSLGVNYRWGGK